MEFLDKPYDNYKNLIREYQPFIVLVNSVYKAYESMSELNTPLHYFIDKAFKNMTHLIDYKFVEIGTNNFDTLIETANGLTVEPLSVYLNEQPNKKNVKNVKLLCNWTNSESVCSQWNEYNTENSIRFTSKNPDYYVIVNHPINNENYETDKTIVFQMEPWVYDESKNWGVKTWGEWARPDESRFLRVYKEKNLLINTMGNMNILSYKKNRIVSICSSKNQDTGHILRNNFIKYIENNINIIDVFGRENYHNFSSYVGKLEDDKTYNEYSKYKYAFTAENNAEINYATEKIYEPIMCECLCFYWGCPNLEEFLNPMVFVRLDLNDLEGSIAIVKKAIEEDWWSERIDLIRKEKERIMKELNFFRILGDIVHSDQ
jgi:hypothetical protein